MCIFSMKKEIFMKIPCIIKRYLRVKTIGPAFEFQVKMLNVEFRYSICNISKFSLFSGHVMDRNSVDYN